ncbi:MAG TPA: DUF4252 domain-containing protein [Candidatus Bathyarchaeia archaeon]|nr:DUF4252 domain-containing protein [Candidatus Bathyarchaeia archaeon]
MRTPRLLLAVVMVLAALPAVAEGPAPSHPGYVDGSMFRKLVDENDEITEVDLDEAMLKALGKKKREDEPGERELFANLVAVHAVIGKVKGPASNAMALVQQTDQKLDSMGWRRITRIKDETTSLSVLTHVSGEQIDGLVVLIFDAEDREIVFANLAGQIDLDKLGAIGERFDVPGLEHIPGAH